MESAESVNPVMRISALHRGQAKKAALGTSYRRRVGLTFRTKPSPPALCDEQHLRSRCLYPGVFYLFSNRAFRTTVSMEVARYNQPLLVGFKCGDGVTVYPQETALFKMQADINGLNSPSVEPLSGISLIPPNSGKRNYVWSRLMKTKQTVIARRNRKAANAKLPKKAVRCTIYALTDKDAYIRYIGQTRGCTDIRLAYHVKDAFMVGSSPVQKWVASGKCTGIVVLQDNAVWNISEALWIRQFKSQGAKLLNVSREHDDLYRAMDHKYSLPSDLKITPLGD